MVILLALLLIVFYYFIRDSVNFCTRHTIAWYIIEDPDKHIANLNMTDIHDRNCNTRDEYKSVCIDNIQEFSMYQKIKIISYVKEASDFLSTVRSPYIDNKIIMSMPWKFVLTNNTIEYGLPHTRGGIIFIPISIFNNIEPEIIRTLIHEKIHVYQKLHSEIFEQALFDNNYYLIKTLHKTDTSANPDINSNVYMHPNGKIMMPRKQKEINTPDDAMYEHPNELIAYNISREYYSGE